MQPTLLTERLILRPFSVDDAHGVQMLAGDFAVADTTLNVPHPYQDGMAEAWISTHADAFVAGNLAVFAITLKTDGTLVGTIGLSVQPRFFRAELGYWIGVPYWRQGYCTEATVAAIEFGFSALQLHKIVAQHLSRNPASGRVMQKAGMRHEGTLRDHTYKWSRFEDLEIYGIITP